MLEKIPLSVINCNYVKNALGMYSNVRSKLTINKLNRNCKYTLIPIYSYRYLIQIIINNIHANLGRQDHSIEKYAIESNLDIICSYNTMTQQPLHFGSYFKRPKIP